MSQNKLKVNRKSSVLAAFKKKPWVLFSFINFATPCLIIIGSTGLIFWFHALLFAAFSSIITYFLFWIFLNFTETDAKALKGYDPWHVSSLLESWPNHPQVLIQNSETSFVKSFDFFEKKRLIISSALLMNMNKESLAGLIEYHKLHFENQSIARLTQWCFYLFILSLPLQILALLAHYLRLPFVQRGLDFLLRYLILLPFYPIIRHVYFKIDSGMKLNDSKKSKYCELLWRMQTYLDTLAYPPALLSCFFYFTNPAIHSISYFNIQPLSQERISKLTDTFSHLGGTYE